MTATNDRTGQPWLALRTQRGEAVTAGGFTVTPLSRSLLLRLPGGAYLWHRPTAVLVVRDGRTTRLPIHDTTRLAQCAIVGASLLLAGAIPILTSKIEERAS